MLYYFYLLWRLSSIPFINGVFLNICGFRNTYNSDFISMEEDGDMLDYVSTDFFDVTFGFHSYISVVTLTAWDNIVGTVFLKLWRNSRGRSGDDEVTPEAVKVVTDHALKTEMSREFSGVESKFYCLKNYNVIAVAFLFVVPHVTRSTSRSPRYNAEMFALTLILPLCEVSEWLSRHNLLVDKMKAILEFNLIPAIRQLAKQVTIVVASEN